MITTEAALSAVPPKLEMPSAEFSLQNYIIENEDVALGAIHSGSPIREIISKFASSEEKISKCYTLLAESAGATDGKLPADLAVKLGFLKAFDQTAYISSLVSLANDASLPEEEQLKYLSSLGDLTAIHPKSTSADKLADYKLLLFPAAAPENYLIDAAKKNVSSGLPSPAGSLLLLEGSRMPWVRQRMAESEDPAIWELAVLDNFNASPKDIMSGFLRLEKSGVPSERLRTMCARAWSRPDFVGYMKTTSEMAKQEVAVGGSEIGNMLGKFVKYSPSVVPDARLPLFSTLEAEIESHSPSQVVIDRLISSGLEDSQARLRAGFAGAVVASHDEETLSVAARRLLAFTVPSVSGPLRFAPPAPYATCEPSFLDKFKGVVKGFTDSIRDRFASPAVEAPIAFDGPSYQTWEQKDYHIKQIEEMLIAEKVASLTPPDAGPDV